MNSQQLLEYFKENFQKQPLKPHPVPGLLGGMGPESTLDFYRKIIEYSFALGAKTDQQHLQVLISILPQTPDRTLSILNRGENPLPYLVESAQRLERAGADFLLIICNTAHRFLPELEKQISLPWLSFEDEVVDFLQNKSSEYKNIALLATRGTYASGVYSNRLTSAGIEVIHPPDDLKNLLMDAIYGHDGVKTKGVNPVAIEKIRQVVDFFKKKQVAAGLSACTEISLAVEKIQSPFPMLDTTTIVAKSLVKLLYQFYDLTKED